MSIIINKNIVFLDSLQFCKASLGTLSGKLQVVILNIYDQNFQKIN